MASNFPTSLDSFTTLVDNVDDVLASHANDRGDSIENIEAKLGVDSSAVTTSIDYFLKHASGAYRTHLHDGTSDDGANIPIANTTGTLPVNRGGTGQTTASAAFDALSAMTTLGDIIYGGASGTGTRLAGNTSATKKFLSQTGTGAVSAAPTWDNVAFPSGYIYGFTISNNSGDTSNDIDISSGKLRDDSDSYDVSSASTLTKRLDASWVVGTNQGGLFTGSKTLNTWYHIFVIRKDADGTIDAGYDTSTTGSNKPAGWTVMRRIGSVRTNSSSNIRQFYDYGKQSFRKRIWDDYTSALSTATPASSYTDIDCSTYIPSFSTIGIFNAKSFTNNGSAGQTIIHFRPNGSSATNTIVYSMNDGHGPGGQAFGAYFECPTDTSQIIEYWFETQQLGIDIGVVGYYENL